MSAEICEICGEKNEGTVFLLPLHQENGSLVTMACEKCAKASSAFCGKHDQIHQGFLDGSTACRACIQEIVLEKRRNQGNGCSGVPALARIFSELKEGLPRAEFEELLEAAETSSAITGNELDVSIVRFIAAKALRTRQNFNEVLAKTLQEKKAAYILT